jgi:hypothetical protein
MEGFANMTTSAESGTEVGSVPFSALKNSPRELSASGGSSCGELFVSRLYRWFFPLGMNCPCTF